MGKWSIGYAILKVYVQFAFWLSHRRITVLGKENIPYGDSVIFAPNHQNALMDPMAVLCTNKTQAVWLARADIFHSKFINTILRFFKILPIYRIRDGKEKLKKNEEIFDMAIHVLENKKAIALFPEAAHSGKRQMVAHKKAVPRIAFQAELKNNFNLNLKIVPVGIYHDHYWHFNRSTLINYGKAIKLSDYKNIYAQSEHEASMKLKSDIYASIEKLSLEIKSKEHYENYELLRELIGDSFEIKGQWHKKKAANRFYSDKKLIERLEQNEKNNPKPFQKLHQQLDKYRNLLTKYNVRNTDVNAHKNSYINMFIKLLVGIFLLPLLALGFLIFLLPFYIPRWYVRKHVSDETFISTFQFVVGLIAHFIFFAAIFIIITTITNNILNALFFIAASLVVGKFSFIILQFWKNNLRQLSYQFRKQRNNQAFTQIEELKYSCARQAKSLLY